MKLSQIKEATSQNSKEFFDIIEFFPNKAQQAVTATHMNGQLVIAGKPVHELISDMEDAVKQFVKSEYSNTLEEMYFHGEIEVDDDGENNGSIEVECSAELEIDEMQEVYLGYSKKSNFFVMGFDVWTSHDDINEAIEKALTENEVPEEYRDELSMALLNDAPTMVGLSFDVEVSKDGNIKVLGQQYIPFKGGFYGGGKSRGVSLFKRIKNDQDVINIRLD